jgi:hypothetical protein
MKIAVVTLATVIHLLPHPFGVSAVGALALYAGAFGRGRGSPLVPLFPLALGLLVTGLYEPLVLAAVAAGFVLATIPGRCLLSGSRSLKRFGGAVGAGAFVFYAVSNLAAWWAFYPHTGEGIVACYVNGLPYLAQSLLADGAYCFVLFGLHAFLERRKSMHAVA